MKKVIISCALTGTAGSKSQTPDIPISPEEIAADTVAVAKAGASMVHIHVHDEQGRPTDQDILAGTAMPIENFVKAIQKACENADKPVN